MQILFASDLHLGHAFAAKSRGFDSVDKHDASILNTLLEQCNKRTMLWVLGDVAMQKESLLLLGLVPGRKKLVRGNHDQYDLAEYLKYFEDVHGFLRYKQMWLSHCPIHPQEMYRATVNVHGHIHANTNSPELPYPFFNVNWDFHRRAVTLEEIRAWAEVRGASFT